MKSSLAASETAAVSAALLDDNVVAAELDGPSRSKTAIPVGTAPADPLTTPLSTPPPPQGYLTPHPELQERPLSTSQHASQSGETATRRLEVGNETIRKTLATVAIGDFLTLSFPSQENEDIISEAYERAPAMAKQYVSTLLNGIPTGEGVEKDMYKPLIDAFTTICDTLWPGQSILHLKNTSSDQGGSPDLTFFANNEDNKSDKWELGLAFIEAKSQDRQDPFYDDERNPKEELRMHLREMEVWNQIQDYATRAYGARARCFMVAIGIFGNYARFFRWDRSLVTVSRGFKYKEEPELLWQFIAGLGTPGYDGSGLDPTVADYVEVQRLAVPGLEEKYAKARTKRLLSLEVSELSDADLRKQSSVITVPSSSGVKEEKYISIGPPLFASGAVLGRGTRAWLAVPVPGTVDNPERSNEDHFVILKDSWREESRAPEGDVYRAIYGDADCAFGIARMRSSVDLYDPEDDSDGHDIVHTTIATWVAQYFGRQFCHRVHHRCILDSVGVTLSRFGTTRQLMEGIRDAVEGHRNMAQRNILHRDISASNVMISAYPTSEGNAKGFLIDMDCATVLGSEGSDDELREITGTTAFLSIERDPRCPDRGLHRTWHDLESFFWVALYIVVRHANMDGTVTVEDMISIFNKGDISYRSGFLSYSANLVRVTGHTPLGECLRRLAKLVNSHYLLDDDEPEEKEQLRKLFPHRFDLLRNHQPFIDTINAALGSGEWPEPDFEAKPVMVAHSETVKRMKEVIQLLQATADSIRERPKKRKQKADQETEAEEACATKRARQEGDTH
ncbi:hypothetical protein OE88DRAFT_1295075 [Heliocybe sulcata]|uniref:Fungal-type protein kinase domain-containing protein n=1 Tax=Heliocybe sulcata TaxID=5364 RepID=A0A5C3N7I4_9AGAM|nr:hypothetical protein OE88DRAFT_1295075 [Heliocybe sulcata]